MINEKELELKELKEKQKVTEELQNVVTNLNTSEFTYTLEYDTEDDAIIFTKYHGQRRVNTIRQTTRFDSIEGFKLDCIKLLNDAGMKWN